MAENKKSIVEDALLDLKIIKEALDANTQEILRSIAKEEIDGIVKESLNEDMYEEEDVDDAEGDDTADDTASTEPEAEPETGDDTEDVSIDVDGDAGTETNVDVTGAEGGEDYGAEEEGGEDYEFDLTSASDDQVISVYKKLSGDDEIEVVSDNEVIIKDPASGAEYNVKMGGETGAADVDGIGGLDLGLDAGAEATPELEFGKEPEVGMAPEIEIEPEAGAETDVTVDDTEDDELGEGVVFEIALGDDEEAIEEDIVRGKGHDKHLQNTSMESGDIEGTKAPKDPDTGDNLTGGFDDDAVSHANAEGPMVMGENDDEVVEEADETLEEAIPVGNAQGRRVPGQATPIKGAGAKSLEEAEQKYQALLAETTKLTTRNEELKVALRQFRKMLGETVIFNSNLTYVTKLFTEHATTSSEKKSIIAKFDEVKSLEESKKLYKNILNDLTKRTPISESVENKITKDASSGKANINESTAYVDPSVKRMLELMKKTS